VGGGEMRVYIIAALSFLFLQGCGEPSVDKIAEKIVKVETPHGKCIKVPQDLKVLSGMKA